MTGITEEQTRKQLIDPALLRASWDVADANQVGIEIPVDGFDAAAWHNLQKHLKGSGEPSDKPTISLTRCSTAPSAGSCE